MSPAKTGKPRGRLVWAQGTTQGLYYRWGSWGENGLAHCKVCWLFSAHIHGHSCSMLQPAVLNGPRRRCGLLPDYCGNLFSHQSPLYFARIIFIERPCSLEIAETTLATFSSCEDLLNFTLYMTLTFEHDQDEPTWEISKQKSFLKIIVWTQIQAPDRLLYLDH